ncbi:carbonyl reductase [NADPH] 1-like isoform X4 [Oratosquilla oratoria]|uniref:carbonyl reductase [NADPH] 1-like isoform X4 n=1 Tax=Oratosquilla oratoria TaxID=337810 RepID=UPI003F75EA09
MAPRICVVTGANKGIGYGIMKELCQKFDGLVYLTARNEERGKAAVAELNKLGYFPRFHLLDIDSEDSINTFAEYLKKTYNGLDVLVNNAAISYQRTATEPFGEKAENTIRVNYFGTLNVCHALFPLLRPHARVVHVSSSFGHLSYIDGDEPQASSLRSKLGSPTLTEEELNAIMNDYVRDQPPLRKEQCLHVTWHSFPTISRTYEEPIYGPRKRLLIGSMDPSLTQTKKFKCAHLPIVSE